MTRTKWAAVAAAAGGGDAGDAKVKELKAARSAKKQKAEQRAAAGLPEKKRHRKSKPDAAAAPAAATPAAAPAAGLSGSCAACSNYAAGRVDPGDLEFYCLACWAEYEGEAAADDSHAEAAAAARAKAAEARAAAAAATAARRQRADSRRSAKADGPMLRALRVRLAEMLRAAPAGVDLASLPRLLCSGRRREGIGWDVVEPSRILTWARDFAVQQGTANGPPVMRLARHIRRADDARGVTGTPGRILLVLDLNHILCERRSRSAPPVTAEALARHPHTLVGGRASNFIFERPYAAAFLPWALERFAVGLWSSGTRRNVAPLVAHLVPSHLHQHLAFIWCQEECTVVHDRRVDVAAAYESAGDDDAAADAADGAPPPERETKPLIMKELKRLWRKFPVWDASTTVLVDDDPAKLERNPAHTAICPHKWCALAPPPGSEDELAPHGTLCRYLDALRAAADTNEFIRERPYNPAEGRI